jgi:hypothetical protein
MYLLLRLAISGNSTTVESGGNKVTLIELSEKILQLLSLSIENITFESDSEVPTNEYFSNRDDLEEYAKRLSFKMTSMEGQIQNVTKAAELQAKN